MENLLYIILGWFGCMAYKKLDAKYDINNKIKAGAVASVGTVSEFTSDQMAKIKRTKQQTT